MNGIYFIIGGNLGNRVLNLNKCRNEMQKRIGSIRNYSAIYETSSWGKEDEPSYLNQILFVDSHLSPIEALDRCLEIEKKMGRVRNQKWESRLIDIDILFYNHDIINLENLKIPHPQIEFRKFVLVPLNSIAPEFEHPLLHKTITQLLEECKDKLSVKIFNTKI